MLPQSAPLPIGNSRMFGPCANVPRNSSGGGEPRISSGLPPPDHLIHTGIHQLQ